MSDATKPFPGSRTANIRFAADADVDALTGLINSAFRVEQSFIEGDRVNPEKVRGYLATGRFLVAEGSASLLGCVYGEIRKDRCYVGLLSVDSLVQGTGLGRKLMNAVENHFREAGCCAVDLRVISARAPLLPFYRHLGYLETGTAPFPPEIQTKVPCHYILMSKSLA